MSDTDPTPEVSAEDKIWKEWFAHMEHPRSVTQPALSIADQIAFLEVAQPIIRAEYDRGKKDGQEDGEKMRRNMGFIRELADEIYSPSLPVASELGFRKISQWAHKALELEE